MALERFRARSAQDDFRAILVMAPVLAHRMTAFMAFA